MKAVWFIGLSDEEKEKFKEVLKRPSQERTRLQQILADKYESIERKGFKEEDYEMSGWENRQAFRNGRLSIIQEIVDLYSSDKESKN